MGHVNKLSDRCRVCASSRRCFLRHARQWVLLSTPSSTAGKAPCVLGTRNSPDYSVTPGGRFSAGFAVDFTNQLWLAMGGIQVPFAMGTVPSIRGELMSHSLLTGLWTFRAGSGVGDEPAVYTTKGAPVRGGSTGPGARQWPACWWSASRFWIFGGQSTTYDQMADLYVTTEAIHTCSPDEPDVSSHFLS
jgi:hypothetical protein